MSIKDRIAMFSKGGGKGSKDELEANKVSEKPQGEIIMHGWLGKAGSGILGSTFSKRARESTQRNEPSPRRHAHHTETSPCPHGNPHA